VRSRAFLERFQRLREQFDLAPHRDIRSGSGRRICASSRLGARPGLTVTKSTPSSSGAERAGDEFRIRHGQAQAGRRSGDSRVSATRTRAPLRASHSAIARPDSPSPSTSAFLPS
jgi:hypothetical protein